MSKNEETTNNFLITFFSNPLAGFIGTIASILGVILAIYFYLGSRESRELTYYVHPVKAAVVKSGAASRLSIKYDNQELRTDITAAQIAFWNNGKLSIRKSNVLNPFIIQLQNNLPILEVSLRKISRDVTSISIDESNLQKGRVSINWEILEHNDGGVIQLIYAGGPDVGITANGIIEGQPEIKQLEFSGKIKSPSEQYSSFAKERKRIGYVSTFGGFLGSIFLFFLLLRRIRRKSGSKSVTLMGLVTLLLYIFMLSYGIYNLLKSQIGVAPFDF